MALADHEDDLTYQKFKAAVDALEPDQRVLVVALMWLGRGDYSVDQWDDACTEAKMHWNTRTAEYLIASSLVADYLEEGLFLLGYSCEE